MGLAKQRTFTAAKAEPATMLPKHRIPTHPGQILLDEFLIPMEILQTQLAEHLEIPVQRINELVKGKRGVTPATAWLLAAAFQTTPDFWMNLQTQHDLAKNRPARPLMSISKRKGAPRVRAAAPTSTRGARHSSRSSRSVRATARQRSSRVAA
jgi:addiction module HigA family antidote